MEPLTTVASLERYLLKMVGTRPVIVRIKIKLIVISYAN